MLSRGDFQSFARILQFTSIVSCTLVIIGSRWLRHRKIQRDYQFIVMFNACVDLAFACCLCVFSFTPMLVDHMFLITVERSYFQWMSSQSTAFIVQIMTAQVETTILCIAVHFWYRYDVVCNSKHWSHKKYLLRYLSLFSIIFIYFVASQFAVEDMKDYKEVLQRLDDYKNDTPVFCVYDLNHLPSVLSITFYQFIHSAFYCIAIYFGIKVIRQIRLVDPTVQRSLHAQRYMIRVLVLQALYPMFLLSLPASLMIIIAYFGYTTISWFYVLSILLQSLPLLNSLSVIFLVPAFRRLFTGQPINPTRTVSNKPYGDSTTRSKSRVRSPPYS
ncbi:unnamed protein product [Bursaphelenchus xylophilus]|uniref:(pine wood nematode) hypothetical protein n=1 Tax=Bursaphelenchus xylophilus TaxID=6326 RepID=A0A1I7SD04_BURXY|nr:unnamed protein product [Bursaphelenchus xylophilus]CAG9093154.1 unnamed protein product [Bursaphelenchus xylophilus]